ncbi:MAG: DUF998 domain-containing protein [Candidatus Thorarchaeota archaeon]
MEYKNENVAGILIFFTLIQWYFVEYILSYLEPGYNFSTEYISELGAPGATNAAIFNASIVLVGIGLISGSYFLYRASASETIFPNRLFAILMMLFGICFIGVGLAPLHAYPDYVPLPFHIIFGNIAQAVRIIAIFVSVKITKPPLSYALLILGVISFVTQILFLTQLDLGLGAGGNQRLDVLVWTTFLIVISTHLMSKS